MTCHQTRRLLSVRREWTAQERARADAHLKGCPACQAVAREYELMDRRLDRLPEPALAMALPIGVQTRLIAEEATVRTNAFSWPRQALWSVALAAAVALVVVATLVWRGQSPEPAAVLSMLPADSTTESAPAGDSTQAGEKSFTWPVVGTLTQSFWEGHTAVDVANHTGTPVYAAADGVVAQAGRDDRHGNFVLLDHGDGYETFYSHLNAVHAPVGTRVSQGRKIGEMGSTGVSTGPHLHFEIRKDGEHLNPLVVVPEEAWANKLTSSLVPEDDTDQPHMESPQFSWPAEGYVAQAYWSGHQALDIANRVGTPIYAAAAGTVKVADEDTDRHGIHIELEHEDGYTTFYSHLSASHVEVGDHVEKKQRIGLMGSTGLSTGPHLHFEIRQNGEPVNPLNLLP